MMREPIPLFCLFFIFWSCTEKTARTSPVRKSITESVYASGIIKSRGQYQVFSNVSGLVQDVYVKEGDTVQKNAAILKISGQAAILTRENASLERRYNEDRAIGESLKDLEIQIEMAKSRMENDALLLKRQQNIWQASGGSLNDLEQRELNSKNSNVAYNSLLLKFKDLRKQLKYNLDRSLKNLEMSNVLANEYLIRSEMKGKVYDILKEPGEMVSLQSPVAVIGDAHTFLVELQVDENDITSIRSGQQALLTMDSYKGQVFSAIITKVNPLMNESSRTFTVEARFKVQPAVLYPNLTVEANIVVRTKKSTLTIPRNYLIDDRYVLMSNHKKKGIVCGLKDYQEVEVISGLDISDVILKPSE